MTGTVAYIIVSWNNKDLLEGCINSIVEQDYKGDKRIYLIDNNSSDDTVEYMARNYPDVHLIAESKNHGFAKGNNIGIRAALKDVDVKYVVLLNTDATLEYNWTRVLVDAAQYRPLAATMQSITLDYFDHAVIDSTHIYISRRGQGTQGSWRLPMASNTDVATQKVYGCNAAAMMITRTFIEAQPFNDFFDETMFMYLEDVDVATRATVMGWDNYVVSGTKAYHMGSVSSNKKDPSFSLYMTFRNNTGLIIKNLPFRIMLRVLLEVPRADWAAIKHLKRIGKGKAVPAVVKGRLRSLLFIPIYMRKRATLKSQRSINTDYLWRLMNRGF